MASFFETVQEGDGQAAPLGEGKFGAHLVTYSNGEKGILKIKPFANDTFRGIPKQQMPRREYAAYLLDSVVLDFGVVPETYLTKWQGREASVQKFITTGLMPKEVVPGLFDKKLDDWKYRIARLFSSINLDDMLKVVLLDLIMNNVDRHGRNVLIDRVQHKVWAIDNGLSFGRYYRGYRSIFHKYLFFAQFQLPEWATKKLSRVTREHLDVLADTLPEECVEETWLRIQFILGHADRLAYKRMGRAQGFGVSKFPSYEEWFRRKTQEAHEGLALVYSPQAVVDGKLV